MKSHIFFYFIIVVLYSSFGLSRGRLTIKDFTSSVLDSKFHTSFKPRFDPAKIRINYKLSSLSTNFTVNQQDKKRQINYPNLPNSTESIINITEMVPQNIEHRIKSIINQVPVANNLNKPQRSINILKTIGNRMKSLLFGSTATIIKGPFNGKSLFSLFDVIKFENTPCSVSLANGNRNNTSGTCYHDFECKSLGGYAAGTCANGLGVCCIFNFGCGGATSEALIYFESPQFPATQFESIVCSLTVNLQRNVKQILIEFLTFELQRPTDGDCIEDKFLVSGQSRNYVVPILCGINTGQHLYIDVENSLESKVTMSVLGSNYAARAFSMRISQLDSAFAPRGCLQYYTEPTGFIKTFNYDETGIYITSRFGTYLNNLNYVICIERAEEMCTLSYTNESNGEEMPFELVNIDEDANSIVPSGQAGAEIFNCPDDFIAINGLRLCGEKFNDGRTILDFTQNSIITDAINGPFILPLRTDNLNVGKGFNLFYFQESC